MIDVSLLIVNFNSWRLCVDALQSFLEDPIIDAQGRQLSREAIVVDNASPTRDLEAEAIVERLVGDCDGKLIRHDENGGYSKGMNLAYQHVRGRLVLISNPDVLFKPGCVSELVRYIEANADAGAVAPVGYWDEQMHGILPPNILPTLGDLLALTVADVSPRWSRRYAARRTKDALRIWSATEPIDLTMLSGCCFLMRRELIERIGFFDERFPLYYEDTDLSQRIKRAGQRIVQVPAAKLIHLYNRSAETNHEEAMSRYWKSRRLYYRKWYGRIGGWIYDATRWFLSTGWAKRRAALCPQGGRIRDAGPSNERPVLRFPASYDRYLVEGALDPHFYLACGIFGKGDSWTPSDSLFRNFGPTTFYWRVLDISDEKRPVLVGVHSTTLVYPVRQMASSGVGADKR